MPDQDDDLLAELRALRSELAGVRSELEAARQPRRLGVRRYAPHRLRLVLVALETDPETQYKVHRWGAIYWLANFPVIIWLFLYHRGVWDAVGIFITLIYSIYANLATDYGAMSAAIAAKAIQAAAAAPGTPPQKLPIRYLDRVVR
jgi:hypothetical protein